MVAEADNKRPYRVDRIVGILAASAGSALLWMIPNLVNEQGVASLTTTDYLSGRFFPAIAAWLLVFTGTLLAVVPAQVGSRVFVSEVLPEGGHAGPFLLFLALVVMLPALIGQIGMYLAFGVSALITTAALGCRSPLALAAMAIGVPGGIYLVFVRAGGIQLPNPLF
jgi:Tripartite tricarboxylate transporter TctB family